ncbi:MAG: NUDIX hydrolase [Bacteriovoracaceae bacterium]|nr:NUDIX hydrolase [Bacteriovoracaceae bacterium]
MISKWETIDRQEKSRGHIFRHLVAKRKSPDTGAQGEFDIIQTLHWVNVIPLTKNNEVVLVRQYRHGTDELTLEIPGGAVHWEEDIRLAGERELEEETGYKSSKWEKLGTCHPNPAFMSNVCETWLARDCEPKGKQNFDDLEEIELVTVPLKDIPNMIKNGEITHSLVIAAFHYLELLD